MTVIHLFETIHEQVPDQPAVASLLAEAYVRTGRPEQAARFMGTQLERHHRSGTVLQALSRVSRRHGLGLAEDLLEKAADVDGLTIIIATDLGDLYAERGEAERGLAIIDEAIAAADVGTAQSVVTQRARLSFLRSIDHPSVPEAVKSFMTEFSDSGHAQSFVLSLRETWDDPSIVEPCIEHLSALLGPRSLRVKLARAQYLVRYHAEDEAKLAEAVMTLADVLEQSPDSIAALTFMAEASMLGQHPSPSRAIAHLERAIVLVPGQLGLYPKLITLLQDEGDFETAARYLKQLGELSSRDRGIQETELALLRRQGDFENALVRATTLFDESASETDQLVLAAMHRRTADFDAAEAIYRELTSRPTVDSLTMIEAAEFYAETGRFARGLRLLVEMQSAEEDFNRALFIGMYHGRHGAGEDAERWLRTAVEEAPQSAQAREVLARFYLKEGRHLEAREQALLGIRLDPENRALRGTLALANLDGDPTGRAQAIQTLRELSDGDDDLLRMLQTRRASADRPGRCIGLGATSGRCDRSRGRERFAAGDLESGHHAARAGRKGRAGHRTGPTGGGAIPLASGAGPLGDRPAAAHAAVERCAHRGPGMAAPVAAGHASGGHRDCQRPAGTGATA